MKAFFRGLLVLAFLVSVVAGLSGHLNELLPVDLPTPTYGGASVTPTRVVAATDQDITSAIQQVIQRSNDEQVQAIASRDSSGMADSVTSDHFQELVQINQSLLDAGVTSIQLTRLDWGAVASSGNTATATTFETWTTTYADGTTNRSRDRNDYSLVLDNGAWKIKADAHPDQSQPQASGRPGGAASPGSPNSSQPTPQPLPFPGIPDNANTSHNWSGYAATGGTFTSVSGTWTVPDFNAADQNFGIDATWVGIGGVRSRDLIQAGTQQTVNGNGSTQYQAWVELLPRASRPVPLRVHAGDSVTVNISEQSADQWLIDFVNNTTGQTYQQTVQYQSSHSSAEWVEEAPSGLRGGLLPLSNFGSIAFTGGSTTKDGNSVSIAGANARAITMVGNNEVALAVPSPLGEDGSSFSVARTEAPSTTAGQSRIPRGRRGN